MNPVIIMEPQVYLVGRQIIDRSQVNRFLEDHSMTWETDSIVAGEQLAEAAGRLCYLSFGKGRKTNAEYLSNILDQKHGSVLEHAVWNFIIAGVSRSFTHELVRHRAGFAYSQLSQRYVDESETAFVMPPAIQASSEHTQKAWTAAMKGHLADYSSAITALMRDNPNLVRKQAREAARSVLPNATETMIFVTANARSLRHFIELRGSAGADAEMQRVALKILYIMHQEAPNLFGDYTIEEEDGVQVSHTEHEKV